ncbi:MAG: ABC transporter permease [Deltaproteobacteria bacterium]|nr:ABC transporter permease [Deltaproteobacteria bacterium]
MTRAQIGFIARRVRMSLSELLWTHVLTAGTMAMTLFVFGAFMLLQGNLETLLKGWGEQIQINAYVEKGAGNAATLELYKRLQNMPEVQKVRLISHEQAWKDFHAALGAQAGILEGLPADVLPASFEISVRPEYRDAVKVAQLAGQIKKEKGIATVEYPQEWVDRLQLIVTAVQWTKWILGGVLFGAALFIVGSTVKLALLARKDEVEIMQLVGAAEEMIQAPFVLEGMIQGVIGAILGLGLLWFLFSFLRDGMPKSMGLLGSLDAVQFLDINGIALILAIGWTLGWLGSLISVRRFLHTWHSN